MTHTEIIKKLIGSIRPIGESGVDKNNLENLKTLCNLVDELLTEIDAVAYDFKDSPRYSEKEASKYASKFLDKIGIEK